MLKLRTGASVRATLAGIVGLILIIGFAASSLVSYQVSKDSLRDALIGSELPLTSDNIYSEIQRDLLRPVFVASMMADDTFVRDWLIEGEQDPTRMIRFLKEIRDQHGMFTSFLISEDTRRYYHFTGISQTISAEDPRDAWYFRVRSMAEEHEINVDFNAEQDNALTIFINHKVFDFDGNYIATTGVGIEFDALAKVVERYKANFSRHVYFIDNQGMVMARSEGAAITEDNIRDAEGAGGIAEAVLSTEQGFYEYQRGGETMLVSARHIPELDWWVIIEQEEATALVAIRQNLITDFFIGLVAIVLTLMVVLYTVNLFYARLEQKAVELAVLAEQEATLNKQLKYESGVKDRFFTIISHDLISPFGSLLTGTEVMAKHADMYSKEKIVELAGMVHERGQGVFNLLRNLLDWARLQIDGSSFEPTVFKLSDGIQDSVDTLTPTAEDKGVRLVTSLGSHYVYADPNMVETVMRNLLSNAIKFTPSEGEITLSAMAVDRMIQVTVQDTGVGIAADRLDGLFELDDMRSTAGTNGEMGTGLGLPLCRELVAINGGSFWIESEEGQGSKFHFTLPRGSADV